MEEFTEGDPRMTDNMDYDIDYICPQCSGACDCDSTFKDRFDVTHTRFVTCPVCNGNGYISVDEWIQFRDTYELNPATYPDNYITKQPVYEI